MDDKNLKKIKREKAHLLKEYVEIIKTCVPYVVIKKNKFDPKDTDLTKFSVTTVKSAWTNSLVCNTCCNRSCTCCTTTGCTLPLYHKCNYDCITHFKECLKQYRGKQNKIISPQLYEYLENAMTVNGIIDQESPKEKRYSTTHIM